MKYKRFNQIASAFLVMFFGVGLIGSDTAYAQKSDEIDYDALLDIVSESDSYDVYLKRHADADYPTDTIEIEGGSYIAASETVEWVSDYCELGNSCAITSETGSITYEVNVPKAGLYNLELVYYPVKGKNNNIGRAVYINDELPYEEAQYFEFTRVWEDETRILRDARDNDVRPRQVESPRWCSAFFMDSNGFYKDAMFFFLNEGLNSITIESVQEPMVIGKLVLTQQKQMETYKEYLQEKLNAGYTTTNVDVIKRQGEDAIYKSNSTLYPIADRSSALTEPQDAAKTRLNTIGGTNWSQCGQWIMWEIEVPKTGLYEIVIKYRQNKNQGVTVVRSLAIDGEVPFEEASELHFFYNSNWQISALGNDDEYYQFFLSEGLHTITLKVELDDALAEILRITDECVEELNTVYRQD